MEVSLVQVRDVDLVVVWRIKKLVAHIKDNIDHWNDKPTVSFPVK